MREERRFQVCAAFDTETNNIGSGDETRAYVVCYQINDLRNVDLTSYVPDRDDSIHIFRQLEEVESFFNALIAWGKERKIVPIICGYNLMFDFVTLRNWADGFRIEVNAQSSTNVYTLDLYEDELHVCRFWDTYHLELNGLAAMGSTAGLAKLNGDWDYTRQRTPFTTLTEEEIGYASRDVQVIPAYLRYLLEANAWMKPEMLGVNVLTKSSIVRQMARNEIYNLKFRKANGKLFKVGRAFELTCKQEHAKDYPTYALRKACFRGGLTFTAAKNASRAFPEVYSLDVTSMHHLFINGRYMPVHFVKYSAATLQKMADNVLNTPLDKVLKYYYRPFNASFNICAEFHGLRLKSGSAFEHYGIALLATAKFDLTGMRTPADYKQNEANLKASENVFKNGWHDAISGASMVAFGKIMEAERCRLFITETELYTMSLVYEWDSMEVLLGEGTFKHVVPADYVTLQSNILYNQKNAMKHICAIYEPGRPYGEDIPESIPSGIAAILKDGSASAAFISAYYNSTVKGSFNGVYGTQAQDIMKPGFMWADSEITVDESTKLDADTYKDAVPKKVKVWFNYGTRIVAGSRLHLCIAIDLLYKAFGEAVQFLGGDTDSLKISAPGLSPEDMLSALKPLHDAADTAIDMTMERLRRCYPEKAADLKGVGRFDIEFASAEKPTYDFMLEAWNKCRISLFNGKNHVTMAGVSRPPRTITIETIADRLLAQGVAFEVYAPLLLGYDTFIPPDITHALMKHAPKPDERYTGYVRDWRGDESYIDQPQAIALYPIGRYIGDMTKRTNARNNFYLRTIGTDVDSSSKVLRWDYEQMRAFIDVDFEGNMESIG